MTSPPRHMLCPHRIMPAPASKVGFDTLTGSAGSDSAVVHVGRRHNAQVPEPL